MDWVEYKEAKRCRGLDQDFDPVEEPVSEEKSWYDWKSMLERIGVTVTEANSYYDFIEPMKEELVEAEEIEEPVNEVEKQNYYNRNGIEVKNVIRDIYRFFGSDLSSWESACIYNIMKYLMRYKYKGNSEEDLDKLIVNVNWLKKEI